MVIHRVARAKMAKGESLQSFWGLFLRLNSHTIKYHGIFYSSIITIHVFKGVTKIMEKDINKCIWVYGASYYTRQSARVTDNGIMPSRPLYNHRMIIIYIFKYRLISSYAPTKLYRWETKNWTESMKKRMI